MLGRGTPWRQGSVLTEEHAAALRLEPLPEGPHKLVVISHDCDIPSDAEDAIEIIVGNVVARNNEFTGARNPRRLHLRYLDADGNESYVELRHSHRRSIPKDVFDADPAREPDPQFILTDPEKRSIKQWLSARYGRPAFPNAFEDRLRIEVRLEDGARLRKLERQIAEIVRPANDSLVALYFDLGDTRGRELAAGDPYTLNIGVVYDPEQGGAAARTAAETSAARLGELFHRAFGAPDQATEIALEDCNAISATEMRLSDLRRVDLWRTEYISSNEEEGGDFLPVAEMPA